MIFLLLTLAHAMSKPAPSPVPTVTVTAPCPTPTPTPTPTVTATPTPTPTGSVDIVLPELPRNPRVVTITEPTASHTIEGSDIELVNQSRIGTLNIARGAARIHIRGGEFGKINFATPCTYFSGEQCAREHLISDVTIENVRVIGSPDIGIAIRANRVLLRDVHVEAQTYAVWNGDFGSVGQGGDVVILGGKFYGSGAESIVRIHDATKVLVQGALIQSGNGGGKHALRVHGTVGQAFLRNNKLVFGGSMVGIDDSGDTDRIGELHFEGNEFWLQNPSLFRVQPSPYIERAVIRNNTAHWSYSTCFVCGVIPGTWTELNNRLLSFTQPVERVR
jgi:hypothetical protein